MPRSMRTTALLALPLLGAAALVLAVPAVRQTAAAPSGPGAGPLAGTSMSPAPLSPSSSAPTSALYQGTASYYGEAAPAGMTVSAWVGNDPVITTTVFISDTASQYSLLVPGDDPETPAKEGPAEGELLRFRVGGVTANESQDFNDGEVLTLDLTVTKVEICLGAFEDSNADGDRAAGEPLLAGVDINVLQFMVVRSYTTTGDEATEPSCMLHDPVESVVRAVDWPLTHEPLGGLAQPIVAITETQGAHVVQFPFVEAVTPTPSPTGPTATPTEIPSVTPVPTFTETATPGPSPTRTSTRTATHTPQPGTPGPSPTLTNTPDVTSTASPTALSSLTPSPTPSATTTPGTITATPSATAIPTDVAVIVVNSAADPGTVGDLDLTLDEAMRLANGELNTNQLSLVERQQILGFPGAGSRDVIQFDPAVFPPDGGTVITIQPPTAEPPASAGRLPSGAAAARSRMPRVLPGRTSSSELPAAGELAAPRPLPPGSASPRTPDQDLSAIERRTGLPEMAFGGDTIDASTAGVTLAAGIGGDPFDGIVISSDGNTVLGLTLRSFNVGLVIAGEAADNRLGGVGPSQANALVNNIAGIVLTGPGVDDNTVEGNYVGVDRMGKPEGNATYGVLVTGGAAANRIGSPEAPNILSANFLDGAAVLGVGTAGNRVESNRIGTTMAGTEAVPNGSGVVVGSGATNTRIGGPGELGNLISGNIAEGIWIQGAGTAGTLVRGNLIGTTADGEGPLPNGGSGVLASDGARDSTIGGDTEQEGNRIAFNRDAGVRLRGFTTVRHTLQWNSITANAGPGIVLEDSANEGIMTPVITDRGPLFVEGWAPPHSVVEVFSDVADEGAIREGSTLAGADGMYRFDGPITGPEVHVTATDAEGNTSAFGGDGEVPPTPSPAPSATDGPRPTPVTSSQVFLPTAFNGHALFTELELTPAFAAVPMGLIRRVELQMTNARHLYGAQIAMRFDASRLEVIDEDPGTPGVQILPGDFPDPARKFKAENLADNEDGTIRYSFTLVGDDELNGDGLMASMRFRAKAPGSAEVAFDQVMLSDAMALPVRHRARGAVIDIGPPPTGTVRPPTDVPPPTTPPTDVPTQPPPTATPGVEPPTATATVTGEPTTPPTVTPPTAEPSPTEPTPAPTTPPTEPTPSEPTPTEPTPTQPTPTQPTPTEPPATEPTPTAVASPTPPGPTALPPGCDDQIVNGGFETGEAWVLSSRRPPRAVTEPVHAGERALLLGIQPGEPNGLSYSSTWQSVDVPRDATQATFSAWTYQQAEPGGGPDRQLFLVYDVDPADNRIAQRQPIAIVVGERADVGAWQRRALTFDVAAYRGQTLWVYASVMNDGVGGRAWMFLDDVAAVFCP